LKDECRAAQKKAYCPYSKFHVGCVLIDSEGRRFYGCNVENAAYPVTICAERTAICHAVCEGMRKIAVIAVIGDSREICTPCGMCRQAICEFSDEKTKIISFGQSEVS